MFSLSALCGDIIFSQYPLVLSVIVAGVIGSASHCSVMCSPAVIAQVFELQMKRKTQWIMALYHSGRVTSYGFLGGLAFGASRFLFGEGGGKLSSVMLCLAGSIFILSALLPKKTHSCCEQKIMPSHERHSLFLFGQFFLRGIMMGFMPCGLIISMLLLAATLHHLSYAIGVMVLFGISTLPVLQLAAFMALSFGKRKMEWGRKIGKTVMVANGIFLCWIGIY